MRPIDSFAELFGYIYGFRNTAAEKQPSYEEVRNEVIRLLKLSEDFPAKGLCTQDEYDQSRYALCAWIDETVLATAWNHRARWRPEMLQRLYYNSADAGEKFFERLNRIGVHQKSIREVFYTCLSLGFKGRYCAPGDQYALQQLKEHHLKLLFDGAQESPTVISFEKNKLFPEAYTQGSFPQTSNTAQSQRRLFWAATLGGPVLIALLFFLIYKYTLYSLGENILRAIQQL